MTLSHQQIIQQIDANSNQITQLIFEKSHIWVQYVLFSWRWWLALGFTFVPWVIWYIVNRKNQSMDRFLYAGYFVVIVSVALNVLGDQYGLWHYRFNLIPILPTYFPWDFTLMPVTVIVLIQIFPKLHYLWRAILFAVIAGFVAEPFFAAIDVYKLIHWRYIYSFAIHFCIFLAAYAICMRRNKFGPLTHQPSTQHPDQGAVDAASSPPYAGWSRSKSRP